MATKGERKKWGGYVSETVLAMGTWEKSREKETKKEKVDVEQIGGVDVGER